MGEIDCRYGFPILPVGDDPCGSDRLLYYIIQYRTDILITMADLWPHEFDYIKDVVKKTGVYWINHCTVYSTPLSPFVAKSLNSSDLIIAPSKFCYDVIKSGRYDNVKYIPHGVDIEVFKPMPEQKKDKFVFLIVARNTPLQKDYPTLFHAYKLFLKMANVKCNKCGYEFESNDLEFKCLKCNSDDINITYPRQENTLLRCHTNPHENVGFNLELMAKRFGILKNVRFTEGHNANFTLPPGEMAKIYNYADVLCVLSTGESFCLPLIEAMACGKPVIAMNFSAPVEHIKNSGAGLLSDIKGMFTTKLISDLCINDELSFAKCMDRLYSDEKLREEMGRRGVEYTKNFSWEIVLKEWRGLLE